MPRKPTKRAASEAARALEEIAEEIHRSELDGHEVGEVRMTTSEYHSILMRPDYHYWIGFDQHGPSTFMGRKIVIANRETH